MRDFKCQECLFALKSVGLKEDWRMIYLYKDTEDPNKWNLKQGIDNLGYIEKGKPTKNLEKPFCNLIDYMEYNGYVGVILNNSKYSYFKDINHLSTFLCRSARQECTINVTSKTNVLTDLSSIEKFVLYYLQPLYDIHNGTNTVGNLCRELTIKNFQYEFSFYKNENGVLYLFCQSKENPENMKIVEIRTV